MGAGRTWAGCVPLQGMPAPSSAPANHETAQVIFHGGVLIDFKGSYSSSSSFFFLPISNLQQEGACIFVCPTKIAVGLFEIMVDNKNMYDAFFLITNQ